MGEMGRNGSVISCTVFGSGDIFVVNTSKGTTKKVKKWQKKASKGFKKHTTFFPLPLFLSPFTAQGVHS